MTTMSQAEGHEFGALGHRVFEAIEALPFPVIAAVNGFALGGAVGAAKHDCVTVFESPYAARHAGVDEVDPALGQRLRALH